MELVTTLRELWRLRAFVLVVALLALFAGLAIAFRLPSLESRKYEVGVASARMLVDTPNSQVVEVAPKGSDMLCVRANLIANLMAEGDVKAAIAQRAGVKPEQLTGIAESAETPQTAKPGPGAYVLTTRVLSTPTGDHLPIIELESQAPDAARAAKLADAAVTGLRDYLDSKAATEQVPDANRLIVSGLGASQAADVVRGDRRLLAVAAALFLFFGGCAAIVLVGSLIRGWHIAAEWEEYEAAEGEAADEYDLARLDGFFDQSEFPVERRLGVVLPVTTPPDYEHAADDAPGGDYRRREG